MPEPTQPPTPPAEKSGYDQLVQRLSNVMLREPAPFQQRLNQLRALYQPTNDQEEFYLNQLALSQLEIERLSTLETGLMSLCLTEAVDQGFTCAQSFHPILRADTDINSEQRISYALAVGFTQLARKNDALALFNRFLNRAERKLRFAQEQFDRLRRQNLKPPPPPPAPIPTTPATKPTLKPRKFPPRNQPAAAILNRYFKVPLKIRQRQAYRPSQGSATWWRRHSCLQPRHSCRGPEHLQKQSENVRAGMRVRATACRSPSG